MEKPVIINIKHSGDNPVIPLLTCADGFEMSVQASKFHYCEPRVNAASDGYTKVEVGFPSKEEPLLTPYAEDPNHLTDTVYGYVPAEVVLQVILKHGGLRRKSGYYLTAKES